MKKENEFQDSSSSSLKMLLNNNSKPTSRKSSFSKETAVSPTRTPCRTRGKMPRILRAVIISSTLLVVLLAFHAFVIYPRQLCLAMPDMASKPIDLMGTFVSEDTVKVPVYASLRRLGG